MGKTRNLHRYWVDKDSNIVVRRWTDEEFKTINPRTHIYEKYWSYYCPICSFLPTPHCDRYEAEHGAKAHERYAGSKHKCVVEHREHELACLEFREEFVEDFDAWVCKQEVY